MQMGKGIVQHIQYDHTVLPLVVQCIMFLTKFGLRVMQKEGFLKGVSAVQWKFLDILDWACQAQLYSQTSSFISLSFKE